MLPHLQDRSEIGNPPNLPTWLEQNYPLLAENALPSKNRVAYWIEAGAPGKIFYSDQYSGKWCIPAASSEIDAAWNKIKGALDRGELLYAKASTQKSADLHGGKHVICVYTRNWRDEADLLWTREVLYNLGFVQKLGYKRDIETLNGVYGTAREWYRRL